MESFPVNIADIGFVIVLLISGALAFLRGFVREVLAIAAWAGAAAVTFYTFPLVQPFARRYIEQTLIADVVTGVVIFLIVVVVFSLVAGAISKRVRDSEIGALDRSLGFLFGLVRGAFLLILAYLALLLLVAPEDRPSWLREARALPLLHYGATVLVEVSPQSWRKGLAPVTEEEPADGSGGAPAGSGERSETSGADRETGYTGNARQDMDRLIRSQQDN